MLCLVLYGSKPARMFSSIWFEMLYCNDLSCWPFFLCVIQFVVVWAKKFVFITRRKRYLVCSNTVQGFSRALWVKPSAFEDCDYVSLR